MLEPDVSKDASPVLRRGRARNRSFLFDKYSAEFGTDYYSSPGRRALQDNWSDSSGFIFPNSIDNKKEA